MINYSQRKRIDNLDFETYLSFHHKSFSTMKNNGKEIFETDKIKIGKEVDNILSGGVATDLNCYKIANEILKKIDLSKYDKQPSCTAVAEYGGLQLDVKGRADFVYQNILIDLKITHEKKFENVVKHFGYANQLWHYSKLFECDTAYLLYYCVPLKKVELLKIDVSQNENEFIKTKILQYGT